MYNIYWMFRCGHEVQGGMSHSPQVPVPYAIVDPQDPEDLDLLAEADAWAVLAPDLTDPHIAALLQGVRDLSLDPGVVEPEPEVNPAASESSCSESESVSGGSAETDIRWYAVWQVPNQPEGGLPVIGIHTSGGPLAYRRILEANRNEFSSIRSQRADSRAAAQALFGSEAAIHQMDPELAERIIRWS